MREASKCGEIVLAVPTNHYLGRFPASIGEPCMLSGFGFELHSADPLSGGWREFSRPALEILRFHQANACWSSGSVVDQAHCHAVELLESEMVYYGCQVRKR